MSDSNHQRIHAHDRGTTVVASGLSESRSKPLMEAVELQRAEFQFHIKATDPHKVSYTVGRPSDITMISPDPMSSSPSANNLSSMSSIPKATHVNPNHYAWAGLTPAASLTSLHKWCSYHRPTLTKACLQALRFAPQSGSYDGDDIFLIMLNPPLAVNDSATPSNGVFTLRDAHVIRRAALAEILPRVAECIRETEEGHVEVLREEKGKDEAAITIVQCGAHVNLVPCYWDHSEADRLQDDPKWKWTLRAEIEGQRQSGDG